MILENETSNSLDLKVLDSKGQVIFQEMIETNRGTTTQFYDFRDLAKGMYFIRLNDTNRVSTRKLIIH